MEGGLQSTQTTFVSGQSHADRIRDENDLAKAGRIRSKTNQQTLQQAGGELGCRSPETGLWNTVKFAHVTLGLVPKVFNAVDMIVLVGEQL